MKKWWTSTLVAMLCCLFLLGSSASAATERIEMSRSDTIVSTVIPASSIDIEGLVDSSSSWDVQIYVYDQDRFLWYSGTMSNSPWSPHNQWIEVNDIGAPHVQYLVVEMVCDSYPGATGCEARLDIDY